MKSRDRATPIREHPRLSKRDRPESSSDMLALIGASTPALHIGSLHAAAVAAARAPVCAVSMSSSQLPDGFAWSTELNPTPITMAASKVTEEVKSEEGDACIPFEAYYCNEQGCWIGSPEDLAPASPEDLMVVLPDGRKFCAQTGVQSHAENIEEIKKDKRKQATMGLFAPVVAGAKALLGEQELNKLRGEVIAQHSKVISAFVDTSESPFGQLVLRRMFEAADKDGNGTLDRQEVRDALHALGFTFIEKKQIDQIIGRGDLNGDEVIDFEEFVKETPKTLRSSLIKLAKQNGHDLGFLA